ncbi:MAG: T9SS type A sorting domain-containing protein [Ignavibacteria bacterium]|nr:T9SS type A sorting domain-containing protein [Ignavibacteria bacterium]
MKFALRNKSFTNLVIYDRLGREVEKLVNEQLNAGSYEADWNASNFPSGVYFYKLTTGDFSKTNKMLLIK